MCERVDWNALVRNKTNTVDRCVMYALCVMQQRTIDAAYYVDQKGSREGNISVPRQVGGDGNPQLEPDRPSCSAGLIK